MCSGFLNVKKNKICLLHSICLLLYSSQCTVYPYVYYTKWGFILIISWNESSHQVAMLICAGFLIAWIPYAVVSVWSAFGRPNSVPIKVSVIPTLLAKSAAMYNPVIYQVIDCKSACCRPCPLKPLQKKTSLKRSQYVFQKWPISACCCQSTGVSLGGESVWNLSPF